MNEVATEPATQEQISLLDLNGRQVYAEFYDSKSPVYIPDNPLHFKTHKLEIMVKNLEMQSIKTASAFNSKNYLDIVNELMACYEKIREVSDEVLDAQRLAASRDEGATRAVGERVAAGVGAGISTNNPLAG
jgi:hypothetical protein